MGKFSRITELVKEQERSAVADLDPNGHHPTKNLEEALRQIPVIEIPTGMLHRCRWQPPGRHSEAELETFGKSVDLLGITDPIVVRPHPDHPNEYEILNGDKRWTVARRKGIETMLARVVEATDEVAHAIFAAGLMHATKPTELQEVDIVLSHLSMRLNLTIPDVAALLRRGFEEQQGNLTNNVVSNPVWQQMMAEYETVTNLALGTFCNHRLVWLKVPPEILAAVREGKLPANNAKAIARIGDAAMRQALLEEAIAKDLSVNQIRARIKGNMVKTEEPNNPVLRMKTMYRRARSSKAIRDPQRLQKLEHLLNEIDVLLSEIDE